jgi:hypothetical protein
LPYIGLSRLKEKITEPIVRKWADTLKDGDKTTLHCVLKYLTWVREKTYFDSAQQMLDDQKLCKQSNDDDIKHKHLGIVMEYVGTKRYVTKQHRGELVGVRDRRATFDSIKRFYADNLRTLPEMTRSESKKIFQATDIDRRRARQMKKPMTQEEVQRLVISLPQPYRAIVLMLFQGALGLAEWEQFNRELWKELVTDLEKPGLLKVDGLIRVKTEAQKEATTGEVPLYYTFLGYDAKSALKEWLVMRQRIQTDLPHLFVVRSKGARGKGTFVPVTPWLIEKNVTDHAKRIGLIPDKTDVNRYRVHPHRLRKLFKSLCSTHGVDEVVAEWCMGHDIDRLGYDESPDLDEKFFRDEYRKVEPALNIISNPVSGSVADEARREARAELNRQRFLAAHFTEREIENMGDLSRFTTVQVSEKVRERKLSRGRTTALNGGQLDEKAGRHKVVAVDEVAKWLDEGWVFVNRLSETQVVIRFPQTA